LAGWFAKGVRPHLADGHDQRLGQEAAGVEVDEGGPKRAWSKVGMR